MAYRIIEQTQRAVLGRRDAAGTFTIERPEETLRRRLLFQQDLPVANPVSLGTRDLDPIEQWPDDDYLRTSRPMEEPPPSSDEPLRLSLLDALQIGAANSRAYQTEKERVFVSALDLDLERNSFRDIWDGSVVSTNTADGVIDEDTVAATQNSGLLSVSQLFANGITVTGMIGLDLVRLLTQHNVSTRGVFADASIEIPLLRGSSEFIVTEPLTQAERDVIYAIYNFERFKKIFAVDIATDYFAVLRQQDEVENERENYRGLVASTRRARRLADAGRLPEIQVDQARQDELRARNRWVVAKEAFARRLDNFKLSLGLPVDASLELHPQELDRLMQSAERLLPSPQEQAAPVETPPADAPIELIPPGYEDAGPLELEEAAAVVMAFKHRLDLRVVIDRIHDAQRQVAVAADQLRADLTLLGSGSIGARRTVDTANLPDSDLRHDAGFYDGIITLDLPLERTLERNDYRKRLVDLEAAVRDVQELEDRIKLEVRNALRNLLESRESIAIQAEAVAVAERRVDSTKLFLEAGRAEIRDVLEAQEALVSAQNALTTALISYRVSGLDLQRDLGVLEVNERGLWHEYAP